MSDYNTIEFTEANEIFEILQQYCREQGLNFLGDNKDFNRREMISMFYQFVKRYIVNDNKNKK